MKPTNVNLSGKTILITGAAGFIASYLVKNLLENIPDIQIVGIDNCNDYYDVALKEYRLKEIEKLAGVNKEHCWTFIKGNIADKAMIDGLFQHYKPE